MNAELPPDIETYEFADGRIGASARCDTPEQFLGLCEMFQAGRRDRDAKQAATDEAGAANITADSAPPATNAGANRVRVQEGGE